jgi:hypothetical protein
MANTILTFKCAVRFQDTVIIRESDGIDGVIELAAGDGCWHTIQQYEANRRAATSGTKPPARESINILDVFASGQLDCLNDLDYDGLESGLNTILDFIDDDSDYSESQDGMTDKISTAWNSLNRVKEKLWEDDFLLEETEEEEEDEEDFREPHLDSPTKVPGTAFIQHCYVYSR